MAWNLFNKKDKEEAPDNSLEEKIKESLKKSKNDKQEAEREIAKIKTWAADAIIDVYADFFPNANLTYYRQQYHADALGKYSEYKELHGSKITPEMYEKCEKIVNGYMNQISLRESKMKLYDKLVTEYTKTQQKLDAVKRQSERGDKMKSHADRLKELDNDTSDLAESMTDSMQLEDISKEMAYKEEYFKQLDQLNSQFSDDSNYNNAISYKNEIDKMLSDLD